MRILNKKNIDQIFFFYILILFFFLTTKIKNNKIENEKKFKKEILNGGKLKIVIAPKKNGAKNITMNLFSNNRLITNL